MPGYHKRKPLTPEGKEIKMLLVELDMTQAEFCRRHKIPENRLTDLLHESDSRRMIPLRLKIRKILQNEQKKSV